MYAYAQPGLGDVAGLGSKLKKVVKKVEQKVVRPVAKVAAVVGTAMYAPQLLPAVASLAIKPKAPEPVPEVPVAAPALPAPTATPPLPAMAPAAVGTGTAAAAPAAPLPQLMPQLLQPGAAPQPQMFSPTISVQAPQAQGDDGTKKLLMYGGLGMGALMLLALARPGRN